MLKCAWFLTIKVFTLIKVSLQDLCLVMETLSDSQIDLLRGSQRRKKIQMTLFGTTETIMVDIKMC